MIDMECGLHCGGKEISWACSMKSFSMENLVRCCGRLDCEMYEKYMERVNNQVLNDQELRKLRQIDTKCISTNEVQYILEKFDKIISHIDKLSSENAMYKMKVSRC